MESALRKEYQALSEAWLLPNDNTIDLDGLRQLITHTCELSANPVILLVDEVDEASDYQVFSAFLGVLRDMYLEREAEGTPTFQSVILAGVHDIKNLRKKIRPDSEHSYNSPWNIAADFTVDLSFSAPEIATMLEAFETDHHTGMDIAALSERLYYYTSGYPFLVSRLCKTIDEQPLEWTVQGVDDAETQLLGASNTLFDDMIKNIENSTGLERILNSILIDGVPPGFDINNPDINLGAMFGILTKCDGRCAISNIIFETVITNYLISISSTRQLTETYTEDRSLFIKDGELDMNEVCTRFATFMRSEYRDEDSTFIERHARLLFLAFLKPIINGTGHYAVEPQTRASKRMDVVVFYKHQEYIVELKIWRGEHYEQKGIEQLANYLKSRNTTQGWLISFCDLKEQPRESGTIEVDDCTISETIVAYRDKT
jgi:hypothetical protein